MKRRIQQFVLIMMLFVTVHCNATDNWTYQTKQININTNREALRIKRKLERLEKKIDELTKLIKAQSELIEKLLEQRKAKKKMKEK